MPSASVTSFILIVCPNPDKATIKNTPTHKPLRGSERKRLKNRESRLNFIASAFDSVLCLDVG